MTWVMTYTCLPPAQFAVLVWGATPVQMAATPADFATLASSPNAHVTPVRSAAGDKKWTDRGAGRGVNSFVRSHNTRTAIGRTTHLLTVQRRVHYRLINSAACHPCSIYLGLTTASHGTGFATTIALYRHVMSQKYPPPYCVDSNQQIFTELRHHFQTCFCVQRRAPDYAIVALLVYLLRTAETSVTLPQIIIV